MGLGSIIVYKKTVKLKYVFLLQIETMALPLIKNNNLLFTRKKTVIDILLFSGGIIKLMKVVYHFLMHKYQS